jgi:hypothetical protein
MEGEKKTLAAGELEAGEASNLLAREKKDDAGAASATSSAAETNPHKTQEYIE